MKTEQEKIAICIRFLESREYVVFSEVMTGTQVAHLIGLSGQTVNAWANITDKNFKRDFPRPLSVRGKAASNRFLAKEIRDWAEKHCEVVK